MSVAAPGTANPSGAPIRTRVTTTPIRQAGAPTALGFASSRVPRSCARDEFADKSLGEKLPCRPHCPGPGVLPPPGPPPCKLGLRQGGLLRARSVKSTWRPTALWSDRSAAKTEQRVNSTPPGLRGALPVPSHPCRELPGARAWEGAHRLAGCGSSRGSHEGWRGGELEQPPCS